MPAGVGAGSLPRQFAHPQNSAVLALKQPATVPMILGLVLCDASPASAIETIIVIQVHVSIVEKTRPRYSFEMCRRSCEKFKTELTPTAAREMLMNSKAQPNVGARLNNTYDPP